MKTFAQLVNEQLDAVQEVFPWDVEERLDKGDAPMLLDIREESEFSAMRIAGSLNVPRGILESACEYDYEETVRELVEKHTGPLEDDAIESSLSRNGRFVSVTITVIAESREQLDNIYRDATAHDDVIMAL